MAPGLYDREDGSVVAVGTVEHRDLEGGFWAVIGGTEAEGDAGKVVAVITNGDEFADVFQENEGLSFEVYGREDRRRLDQDGRPGDHREARRARGRGRAGGVAPGRRSGARRAREEPALRGRTVCLAADCCLVPSKVPSRSVRRGSPADDRIRRSDFGGGPLAGGTTL